MVGAALSSRELTEVQSDDCALGAWGPAAPLSARMLRASEDGQWKGKDG